MPTEAVAGVAGLPQANDISACDTATANIGPAETAVNPGECRTFDAAELIAELREEVVMGGGYADIHDDDLERLFAHVEHTTAELVRRTTERDYHMRVANLIGQRFNRTEIDARLAVALIAAGSSALGMPGTVDTIKAMLDKAGLALMLK